MNPLLEDMNEPPFRLPRCPIVEAVVDIRCDMPPALDLAALEAPARDLFRDQYPKFQTQFLQQHRFEQTGNEPPKISAQQGLQAFQFLTDDQQQLVQVRVHGFSFNRLAPYSSLDDYLPEIERTWRLFLGLAEPVQIREIRLRYINRLLLPLVNGKVEFNDYLKVSPRLPDEEKLHFIGFFNQHAAVEVDTGNQVNIIMTIQPAENDRLPLIFDIEAIASGTADPGDWSWIRSKVDSLRSLKNRVFKNTLTEKCLNLYLQSES